VAGELIPGNTVGGQEGRVIDAFGWKQNGKMGELKNLGEANAAAYTEAASGNAPAS
jgi:hypothetical protein